jgi:hypothetical protein
MTYSFAPNDQPLYVSEGDYVQFRFIAPNQWNTTNTVTINIGDLVQFWLITTIPEDFTPDPFPFNDIDEADLDVFYTTDVVFLPPDGIPTTSVTGLTPTTQAAIVLGSNLGGGIDNYAMRIDYDGNGTWDTGWIQSGGAITVENGAKIQVRLKSSEFNVQFSRLTLVIGTSSARWDILTIAQPTNEPEPFPDFTDLEDQPTNTYCYSEVIRLQGLIASATINTSAAGEWAISSTNNTTTNSDGFQVLSGVTFSGNSGTVNNGDYLQLRILSSNNALFPLSTSLSIGDAVDGGIWTVETGANPSTNPAAFSFPNVFDAIEDTLVGSEERPASGITGLTDGIQVPVTLLSTNSTNVRVKKNDDSVGVFPTTVGNGDRLTLYLQSSPSFDTPLDMLIQVGDRQIPAWQVKTSLGPDTLADYTPPANRNNQVPGSFVASSPVTPTGINRPITIENVGGYPALISIDFDTPAAGPRTFDPLLNTSFYIVIQAADQLNTPEFTIISVGGDFGVNQFQWQVTTYATVPPPSTDAAIWYSRKSKKFDGYPIGTVLPVLKESVGSYGDLDGGNNDRYPGFVPCDGRSLDKNDYFELYTILDGEYGETTDEFNVPDYRNRKLCGVGIVDGTRGNSTFVPITPGSSKGINDPGAEGGFWYFNRVGARGSDPLDQVQGPPGAVGGLDSDFFSLGTVRLTGLETLTDQVIFEINPTSFVAAQVGGMSAITVAAPTHNHAFISAVVESDGGEASIPWNQPLGRGMMGAGVYGPTKYPAIGKGEGLSPEENKVVIQNTWKWFFSVKIGSQFQLELKRYFGNDFDFDDWAEGFPTTLPYNQVIEGSFPNQSTELGPESDDLAVPPLQFQTWWLSPFSALAGVNLQNRGASNNPTTPNGNTNRYFSGVFDTQPGTTTISQYTSTGPGTQTRTHSHLITENPVGNPNADFTGGNLDALGSNQSPLGSGLGGGVDGALLTFNIYWSNRYVVAGGKSPNGGGVPGDGGGAFFSAGVGEWSYRQAGAAQWNNPSDEETRDEDMVGGSGSGMRMRITYQAWPNPGGGSANDTRIRVDQILSAGSGYTVGDELSTTFWNNIDTTANKIIEVAAVAANGSGGAAGSLQVVFTQSDVFMDLTPGTFVYSSSFKRPTPDVEMQPQRQVPIINPFHKTKYIIKAY